MLATRWQRAAQAQAAWAEPARTCFDFFEGRQYTADQIAKLTAGQRPSFKFNVIAPLVRLVIGYHRSNKSDITFSPGHDMRATEITAEAMSQLEKAISRMNKQEFVDCEVFLDGLVGGRGFFRTMLDWENNDLGEISRKALDPFTCYPDPDAWSYDLNESASYVTTSKYVSIDDIEANLGKQVMDLVAPFTKGQTPNAPISSLWVNDEVTPVRYFGQYEEGMNQWWDQFYSLMGDWVDPYRKTIRVIETEYKVREVRNVMIDLETGDKKVLPLEWGEQHIQKALMYADAVQNPCVVQNRLVERIHWTTICGDLILYDAPSMYDKFTVTGYFPYFRRGVTRGMVEDLLDSQREKNKRRNSEIEMLAKTANGGWMYGDDALDPVEERKLARFGSSPGVRIKYKMDHKEGKPEQITPATSTANHERLEAKADEDIRRISGINESALGDTDIANQSGRAILARQRQATISVQMYMDNFKLSKLLLGEMDLKIIQNFYSEPRIYRITGDDGKLTQVQLNQVIADPASGAKRIINGVTFGKYEVAVDDAPLSSTFLNAQWDEMMEVLEKLGPYIQQSMPMFADLIIGMSTMPRKDEWIAKLQQVAAQQQQQQQIQAAGGAPPAPGGGAPPAAPPAAPPQGGNVVPIRG